MGCTAHHDVDRDTSEFQILIFLSNLYFCNNSAGRRTTCSVHRVHVWPTRHPGASVYGAFTSSVVRALPPIGDGGAFQYPSVARSTHPLSYSSPPLPKPSRIDYRRTYSSLDSRHDLTRASHSAHASATSVCRASSARVLHTVKARGRHVALDSITSVGARGLKNWAHHSSPYRNYTCKYVHK